MRRSLSIYPPVLLAAGMWFAANWSPALAQGAASQAALHADIAPALVDPVTATATAALAALVMIVCMGVVGRQNGAEQKAVAGQAAGEADGRSLAPTTDRR